MQQEEASIILEELRAAYPDKFASVNRVFSHIHRGDVIFIASGCGEPQYLVQSLIEYVESHPKGFFDAEVLHLWSLGLAPYADDKFKRNFRHNSFFLGDSTRNAVNRGVADYSPVSLSQIPRLFKRGIIKIDVALIQVSLPDRHGYMSLGVSVDMVKAATDMAAIVIAQPNRFMPRVHGDSFIHVSDIDYIMPFDEPLLEYRRGVGEEDSEVVAALGGYVARLVQDGDTGRLRQRPERGDGQPVGAPSPRRAHQLLSDGIVELMKAGKRFFFFFFFFFTLCFFFCDSRQHAQDHRLTARRSPRSAWVGGKRMGSTTIRRFPPVDYNNPLIIAQQENMVAINGALEIDAT